MISPIGTQHPTLGKRVTPAIVRATGTSSLQGSAAEVTQQHVWAWTFKTEQPSHSSAGPQQQQGRHGAPGCVFVSGDFDSERYPGRNVRVQIQQNNINVYAMTHLAADLGIEAANPNLSRTSKAVGGWVEAEIGTA